MIYSLKGKLAMIEPNFVVMDVAGVGFGVKTTKTTLRQLPAIGEEVFLHTHMHVREDAMELFGFFDPAELVAYKLLIGVSGVGPKAALSLLSDNTPDQFTLHIASGDAKSLTRSAGIGLKTAQRIVLELKDKISSSQLAMPSDESSSSSMSLPNSSIDEAVRALESLGFHSSKITSVVKGFDPQMPLETMIKTALKQLASTP